MIRGRLTLDGWPRQLVSARAMRDIGEAVRARIVQRTFVEGRGVDDRALKAHSTDRIVVYFDSELARRLKPKGGRPWYARRGPAAASARASGRRGPIIGREYQGGYAEFVRASRRGLGSGKGVDLTLSGQLSRSLVVTAVRKDRCVITIRGAAVEYAAGTDDRRPWWGLSPTDRADVLESMRAILAATREGGSGPRLRGKR